MAGLIIDAVPARARRLGVPAALILTGPPVLGPDALAEPLPVATWQPPHRCYALPPADSATSPPERP